MNGFFRQWLIAVVLLTSSTVPAAPLIKAIDVRNTGPGRIEAGFIEAHTSVRAGHEFDASRIADDVRRLVATERFSYVGVEADEQDDGVRLILVLTRRLRLVDPVKVEGADHLRDNKVRDLLDLKPGDLIDDSVVAVRCGQVVDHYRKHRFPDAQVKGEIDAFNQEEGLARLTVTIVEGGRARVRDVAFEGSGDMAERQLRKAVKQRSAWNPIGWVFKKRYDPNEWAIARQRVRALYLDEGYLDARVDEPRIDTDGQGNLTVTMPIERGPQYRFGKLGISGNTLFPEAELRGRLDAREGFVAAAGTIDASARHLRDFYGARGYVDTMVRPLLKPDAGRGVVDIEFNIHEGDLARIRNVFVRGNMRTRDKVVRRELLVYPGEIYNETKVERSERRIMNLGFFSDVRSYPEPTPLPSERDLVIEVEEKRTGQFMVGAGFSSIDKVVGFMEISQGNFDIAGWPYFTGGGQKLKLRSQFGSRRKDYELSFVEPWFLDRKLSLGLDLYLNDYDYDDYEQERIGGAVSLGRALPGANRADLTYRLESVSIRDVADTNRYVFADSPEEEFFFMNEEDRLTSSMKLALTHDTRDSPFFPTRGNRASVFGSVAGGVLGFDTDIYGAGITSSHYVPLWFGHVLGFRLRYEMVEEYGSSDEVPIGERLFLGGGRTVRGFQWRDVGPKVIRESTTTDGRVVIKDRPVGGRSLALGTVEYTIPIVKGIRFAGFYDTGNVWWDVGELDLADLASGAGVGLRLDVPGFPIRIDRAWVVERDDEYSDEDPWVIWIGYDY